MSVVVSVGDIDDECPSFEMVFYPGQFSLDDRYVLSNASVDRLVINARDIDSVSYTQLEFTM